MEPFCIMLHSAVHNIGIVKLCADDISIVLQSWFNLPAVHKIFQVAEEVAGLTLKAPKCVLVPLSAPLSPRLIEVLRDFLRARVAPWAQFAISSSAEYLGIWLGP
eukprot:9233662-Karenia_brevis.AAC.1